MTCIYEGKITVIGIPEKDSDNEYIIVDDWLYLYTKPTVEETGRKVSKHSKANNYDWAMPEELNGNVSKKRGDNFKNKFNQRSSENISTVHYNSKQLRKEIFSTYNDLASYVLIMAKRKKTPFFITTRVGMLII